MEGVSSREKQQSSGTMHHQFRVDGKFDMSACSVSQAFSAATRVTNMLLFNENCFPQDFMANTLLAVGASPAMVGTAGMQGRNTSSNCLNLLHRQTFSAVGTLLRRSRSVSTGGNRIGGECWYAQSRLDCINAACS